MSIYQLVLDRLLRRLLINGFPVGTDFKTGGTRKEQ